MDLHKIQNAAIGLDIIQNAAVAAVNLHIIQNAAVAAVGLHIKP